jgi:hypothetical protein
MKRLLMLLICVSLCLAMGGVASANLVVNGTFETISYTPEGVQIIAPSWTGWTTTPAAQGSNYDIVGYVPGVSTYEVVFAGPGPGSDSIGQVIQTVPGMTYTFSFWLAQPEPLNSGYTPGDFKAYWNDNELLRINDTRDFGWTLYTYSVLANDTSSAINFFGRANINWDVAHGFFLTSISVTPVPLPSTPVLLGSGLLSLLGWRRLRRR